MLILIPERFHIRHGAHVVSYMRAPLSREMARGCGTCSPAARTVPSFGGHQPRTLSRWARETFVAAAVRDMTERRGGERRARGRARGGRSRQPRQEPIPGRRQP